MTEITDQCERESALWWKLQKVADAFSTLCMGHQGTVRSVANALMRADIRTIEELEKRLSTQEPRQ